MRVFFNFIIFCFLFGGLYYLYDKDALDILEKEFVINSETKQSIYSNFEDVQYRIDNGPFIYEEVVQEGLALLDIKENREREYNKRIVFLTLKSKEKHISYNYVQVSIDLYNKDKELIDTLKKEYTNFKPGQEENIEFDISNYDASFYKIRYHTKDFEIIK